MDDQEIIALALVALAAAFLLRSLMVTKSCGSGCGKCDDAPVAGRKSLPMS